MILPGVITFRDAGNTIRKPNTNERRKTFRYTWTIFNLAIMYSRKMTDEEIKAVSYRISMMNINII